MYSRDNLRRASRKKRKSKKGHDYYENNIRKYSGARLNFGVQRSKPSLRSKSRRSPKYRTVCRNSSSAMKRGHTKFRSNDGAADGHNLNEQPGSLSQHANVNGNDTGGNNANGQAGSSLQHGNANNQPPNPNPIANSNLIPNPNNNKRGYCPCGKRRANCPQCGGSSLCPHRGCQKTRCFLCPNGGFGKCLCRAKLEWKEGSLRASNKERCKECGQRVAWAKGSKSILSHSMGERGMLNVTDESAISRFIALFLDKAVCIESVRTARLWGTMIESDYDAAANALFQLAGIKRNSAQAHRGEQAANAVVAIVAQMDDSEAEEMVDEAAQVCDDVEHVAGALVGLAVAASEQHEKRAETALLELIKRNGEHKEAANTLLVLAGAKTHDQEVTNAVVTLAEMWHTHNQLS